MHLVEHDDEVASADAAEALGESGDAGFAALVDLCSSASIKGYRRSYVFDAAAFAALEKRARKTRLREVLHPILEDTMAKAREELKRVGWLKKGGRPTTISWTTTKNLMRTTAKQSRTSLATRKMNLRPGARRFRHQHDRRRRRLRRRDGYRRRSRLRGRRAGDCRRPGGPRHNHHRVSRRIGR